MLLQQPLGAKGPIHFFTSNTRPEPSLCKRIVSIWMLLETPEFMAISRKLRTCGITWKDPASEALLDTAVADK